MDAHLAGLVKDYEYRLDRVHNGYESRDRVDAIDREIRSYVCENKILWSDYFLGLAFIASRRSPDPQTKHGCVITDSSHHILGTGYNGHPREMKDSDLPKLRPAKYPWMIHSEENALLNCIIPAGQAYGGATAYITGEPCFHCGILLWQAGVTNWVIAARKGWTVPPNGEKENKHIFFSQVGNDEEAWTYSGLTRTFVKPDLNWIFDDDFRQEMVSLGFVC